MHHDQPNEGLDLGDAVAETKGTLVAGKIDLGSGFHQGMGLTDDD